ncbi:hypothetical protein MRX96_028714 [Rhipicephalus microplus]
MAFGVIVFDQEYEDTGATCWNLNSMGPYSRFETSSSMLLPTSGGQDALRMEEGCYIVVCNTSPVFLSLLTEMQRCAIRAFDTSTRRTFVFDDEQSLCQKLCLAKANHNNVVFVLSS